MWRVLGSAPVVRCASSAGIANRGRGRSPLPRSRSHHLREGRPRRRGGERRWPRARASQSGVGMCRCMPPSPRRLPFRAAAARFDRHGAAPHTQAGRRLPAVIIAAPFSSEFPPAGGGSHMKRALAITFAVVLSYAWPSAQTAAKKPLSIDDYTKWRSIAGQEISGDGKWVTYVLQLTNVPQTEAKPVQHVLNVETNEDVQFANATGGTFSSDSKWLAYSVDPNPGRGNRGRGGSAGAVPQPPADSVAPAP